MQNIMQTACAALIPAERRTHLAGPGCRWGRGGGGGGGCGGDQGDARRRPRRFHRPWRRVAIASRAAEASPATTTCVAEPVQHTSRWTVASGGGYGCSAAVSLVLMALAGNHQAWLERCEWSGTELDLRHP
jgi:hypothetical protein